MPITFILRNRILIYNGWYRPYKSFGNNSSTESMSPVTAREQEGSELGALGGGAPQTPAGGLRPPAQLLKALQLRRMISCWSRSKNLRIKISIYPVFMMTMTTLMKRTYQARRNRDAGVG